MEKITEYVWDKENWCLLGNKCGKTATVFQLAKKAMRNARRRELYKKKKEEKRV